MQIRTFFIQTINNKIEGYSFKSNGLCNYFGCNSEIDSDVDLIILGDLTGRYISNTGQMAKQFKNSSTYPIMR